MPLRRRLRDDLAAELEPEQQGLVDPAEPAVPDQVGLAEQRCVRSLRLL